VTDHSQPRTTVLIPVWDGYVELRFKEALASIAAQDVPVTVIVVDNASHVPLPATGAALVLRSPERISLGAARNLGLEQVQTENVIFADADDLLLPGTIKRLEQGIDSTPRLIAFAMAFVDADTGRRHRWPHPWIARLVRRPHLLALINAVWAVYPITGPVLVRTDLARAAGGHADVDNGDARCLGAALLFHGPVGWSEHPGCVYHQRPGSNLDRHQSVAALLERSALVRKHIKADPGAPSWMRGAMPLLALAQSVAVYAYVSLAAVRRTVGARARR
jgi:Glycosyl transferase family 2